MSRPTLPPRIHAVLYLSLGLALACAAPEPPPAPPAPDARAAAPAADRQVWRTADGVELPYFVQGAGATTVVLVHCWMCDHTFWDAQVPLLAERYRVITLDLPGHGAAGATREHWSVGGLGADVAGLIEGLDLHDVVLVGHSMGGPVALRAAGLARGRVRGIVALDTLHDAEFDFGRPEVATMLAMFDGDFAGACNAMVEQMFVENGVADIEAEVHRKGCNNANSAVGQALMHDYPKIPFPEWFREAGVPIRAINAAGPNKTKIEINRKYADFDAVLVDGVGHYLHMTRPDEVNPLLLKILDELDG